MKCKIIKAGFECDDNAWFNILEYYVGVVVQTYKPRKYFNKKDKITIQLVSDRDKERCLKNFKHYIESEDTNNIIVRIIKGVKEYYGISEKDIEIDNLVKYSNNSLDSLIGKEFDI